MNRARVIEMAKEAGFGNILGGVDGLQELEHFAALVLAQAMEPAGSGSGHSAAAGLTGSYGSTARELAGAFRTFTKSSHTWSDGRPMHIVAAEVLEHFAATSAARDTERLDWLERHFTHLNGVYVDDDHTVRPFAVDCEEDTFMDHKNRIRNAVDAARSAAPKEA